LTFLCKEKKILCFFLFLIKKKNLISHHQFESYFSVNNLLYPIFAKNLEEENTFEKETKI